MQHNNKRPKRNVFPPPGNVRCHNYRKFTEFAGMCSILLGCLVFSLNAVAENTLNLKSPEQGWSLQLNVPTLVKESTYSTEEYFRYTANSGDGFYISLHVKPLFAEVISPAACRDKYHHDRNNLPAIVDKASLEFVESAIPEVHYNAQIDFKEQKLAMPNSHYYFVVNGYCADLHIGASPVYDDTHPTPYREVAKSIKNSLQMGQSQITALKTIRQ